MSASAPIQQRSTDPIVPSIVIAHAALENPTRQQLSVVEAIVARAGRAVVMSDVADEKLRCGFDIDRHEVAIIPALRRVLTEPRLADAAAAEARRLAPAMAWPVVAGAYLGLARRVLAQRRAWA